MDQGYSSGVYYVYTPVPTTVDWTEGVCNPTETSAYISIKAVPSVSGTFGECGITLKDADTGAVVGSKTETADPTARTYLTIYYYVTEELGVVLTPGKTYTYQFYTYFNGVRYDSPIGSFTTPHTHAYTANITAPTCTQQGYTTHTCSICADSYVDTYVSALGHDFGEWKQTEAPTCTGKGEEKRTCSRCDAFETREVAELGHNYLAAVTAPTCTEKGYTTYTCTRCGDSYIAGEVAALNHTAGAAVEENRVAPTCTTNGGFDTVTYCTTCGAELSRTHTELAALGHEWNDGEVTTPATATTDGVKTFTCKRCGAIRTEAIPATGENVCKHENAHPEHKDATCVEAGYDKMICDKCGAVISEETIPALGHDWDNGEVTTPATATKDGVKTFTCKRCGATRTETIPATGETKLCDGGPSCPSYKFKDVKAGDWYHEAIDYAVKNGLFNGMSDTAFEPNTPMTRGMLVTVLWRYEGQPEEGKNIFSDVGGGLWYTDAVAWAASKGIVTGVGEGKFDPNGKITREQMAAILYRYSKSKGYDTGAAGNLNAFPDAAKVSNWAKEAYSWAVAEGLITGNKINGVTMLDPQGNATRAQVATILMRFIEKFA